MNEFDILSPDLIVHQPFLLEASAGTGKTYSIENIVVKALLENPNDGPFSIKEILVVTFTKAAAKELKARILSNLQKTYDIFNKNGTNPESLHRLKKALIEFDLANISTIHSFCFRAITENATSFRFSNNPENLASVVWKVLERHFHTKLTQNAYTSHQLNILLKPHQYEITNLARDIIQTIGKGIGFAKTSSNFFHIEEIRKGLSQLNLNIETFENYAYCYKGLCRGSSKTIDQSYLRHLTAMLHQPFDDSFACELYKVLTLFSSNNLKANSKPPEEIITRFDTIQKLIVPHLYALSNYEALFARLCSDCQVSLHDEFEASETCDFSYLLLKIERLISTDSDFKSRLKKRYRMAIIDEFQDTDPLQWKIFQTLFGDGTFPLILVGDPKQSIYAFRNADIYTYFEAKETIKASSHYLLTTNYRSTPELISALNHLFNAENAPGWISLPYLGKNLPYIPVKAPNKGTILADNPALHFLAVASELKLQEIEEQFLFPKFLEEVQKLQKQKNIPLSQFAFLVRDKNQSERLLQFFQAHELPAIEVRLLKLEKALILPDLIHLLRAIESPRKLGLVQVALGTRFFNWSSHDLAQLKDEDFLSRMLLHFNGWHQIWKKSGIIASIEEVLSTSFLSSDSILEQLLQSLDGLKRYHELRQILEWLELNEFKDMQTLIEELESILSIEHPFQENMKLRPLVEKEAVQILTLHLSKGLEFEVVFALGVINRSPSNKGLTLVKEENMSVLKAVQEDDPSYENYLEESDAEKSRQLYVALTRAKSHLFIPYIDGWKAPPLGQASALELWLARVGENACSWKELYKRMRESRYNQLEELVSRSTYITLEKLKQKIPFPYSSQEVLPELLAPKIISLDFPNKTCLSFTSLAKTFSKKKMESPPNDFNCENKSSHTLPVGICTGELLHHILEEIPFKLIQTANSSLDLKPFIHRYTNKTLFEPWDDVIADMVYQAFQTQIPGLGIVLKNLKDDLVFREMEFIYPLELANDLPECKSVKGQVNGVIDLFFNIGDKFYLLDWKSNWLGKDLSAYQFPCLHKAMEENRYDLQANLYIRALKAYLAKTSSEPFEKIYGGTIYYFLRGGAPYVCNLGGKC